MRVKLNKGMIIKVKFINKDKMFLSMKNMNHIVELESAMRGGNYRSTNTSNVHTCVIRCLDLISAMIPVMHSQFI
jgi:hypothetical protein